jgi:hypothetical protein
MTELTIARLSATVHSIEGFDDAPSRVDRILHRVAERRLDERLGAVTLPEGDWCIRRLDVVVNVDTDDHDATIEEKLADGVVESLRSRIAAAPSDGVVHYRRPHDALTDLVESVASGRTDRSWAWRKVGVLGPNDPSPDTDPCGAVVAAIERCPHHALQAIIAASRSDGLVALHRVLGIDGWRRVATAVATATGVAVSDARRLAQIEGLPALASAERTLFGTLERSQSGVPVEAASGPTIEVATAAFETYVSRVLGDSTLAAAMLRSGLRPHHSASAWAILAISEADPCALRNRTAERVIALAARKLDPTSEARSPSGLVRARPAPSVDAERSNSTAESKPPTGKRAAEIERTPELSTDEVELPNDQSDRNSVTTGWGGLLFLLHTAAAAGFPDEVLDDPRLEGRTVRWLLHQLATLLVPLAATDAAALAFAGLPLGAEPPGGTGPTDDERLALAEIAERWARATAQRLDRDEEPFDVMAEVGKRRAEIVSDPGWIEVHLDLDDVDVDVRRAGLDLDPGWIPWLGVVVRFRYA